MKIKNLQAGFIKFTKKTLITSLGVWIVIVSSGLLYLFGPWTKKSEAAWFDDNWAFRKAITLTNTTAETGKYATLANYDASDTTKFQTDCGDVRFTKQNGEVLPYTVDTCDSTTNFHIEFDTLTASSTQTVYLYYGNPSVADGFMAADRVSACADCTFGTPASEEKGPGPTLYWNFDEAQGTTAQDNTSNNLDGTLNGDTVKPAWKTEDLCVASKCLYFDGTSTNQNVSRADNDKLDFVSADLFTLSAWVRHSGAAAIGYVAVKASATGTGAFTGYKLYMDSSGHYCFAAKDGTNAAAACTTATYADNKWHFLTGVRAAAASTKIYVDGALLATDTTNVSSTLINSGTFYVGSDTDGNASKITGFIDDVKLYRDQTARTNAQVAADYSSRGASKGTAERFGRDTQNNKSALSDGLVGYWKMEETSTPSLDSSGNGVSGTWNGNTTSGVGKFGNAVDLDGTGDYVETASNVLNPGSTNFTAAVWFKIDALTVDETFISQTDVSGTGRSWLYLDDANSNRLTSLIGGTSTAGTTTPSTGTWYHATVVYNNGTVTLYLNGVQEATGSRTAESNSGLTRIGVHKDGSGGTDGRIDDVRIYNRALSNTEVSQLYNFAPGPVLNYKFDEGSLSNGSTVVDSSGYGNNGTSLNAPESQPGKLGDSYYFKRGGTSNGIYCTDANCGGTGASQLDMGLKDITVEAWVKLNATLTVGSEASVLTKMDGSGTTGYFFGIDKPTSTVFFRANSGTNVQTTTDGTALAQGSWYHIAASVNRAGNITRYVNGVPTGTADSISTLSSTSVDTTEDLCISGRATATCGSDRPLNDANVDDVKVYNYVRTQKQIVEDMNGGHPAPGSPVGSSVGYWKFDEGAANTCYGGTKDACNSGTGGTTQDGAFSATAPTITNSGKFGKALTFVPASSTNVDVEDFAATETQNTLTWSFWIKPGTLSTDDCIFCKANGSAATQRSWAVMTGSADSSKVRLVVFDNATDAFTTNYAESPTGMLTNGTWTHVVAVYDATEAAANRIRFYINGLSRTATITGTIPSDGTVATTSNAKMGATSDGTAGQFFDGTLDEVKVYTSALTADQVRADMNQGQQLVLGANSQSSGSTDPGSAASQEYCVPGDATSCAGPVLEWNLDEKFGDIAIDRSGNGRNGTITTGTKAVKGKVGSAYKFDGADTKIETSTLTLPQIITLEAWIYPKSTGEGGNGRIFSTLQTAEMRLTLNSSSNIICRYPGTTGTMTLTTTTTVSLNTWTHITTTYDGSSSANRCKIYFNGVSQPLTDNSDISTAALQPTASWVLGNRADQSTAFDGYLDNFKIFDYVRTPAQVAWDYNHGGPVGWWKMDECQGTTVYDASGFGNNGTLTVGVGGSNTGVGDCSTAVFTSARYEGGSGKFSSSVFFDGAGDYINVSDNDVLEPTVQISVSAWVYPTASPTISTIVGKCNAGAGGCDVDTENQYFIGANASSQAYFRIDGSSTGQAGNFQTLPQNQWTHLMGTYDGTTLKFYENGVLTGSTNVTTSIRTGTDTLSFGRPTATDSNYYTGKIDDVRIYNYALSATQVKNVMNEGGAVRFGPSTGSP